MIIYCISYVETDGIGTATETTHYFGSEREMLAIKELLDARAERDRSLTYVGGGGVLNVELTRRGILSLLNDVFRERDVS